MLSIALCASAKTYDLTSPDGKVKVAVEIGEGIEYSLSYGDEEILAPSQIGLEFKGKPLSYSVRKVSRRTIDQMHYAIVPVKAKENREHCNELKIAFKGN